MKEIVKKFININLVLILIWMGIIFYFSHQPTEISGKTSASVTTTILKVTNIINSVPEERKTDLINAFDLVIRKIAHYSIYAIGGILLYLYLNRFNIGLNKKVALSLALGFLYASLDEIHQHFIPGRACMWQDIGLDSLGVLTGIVITMTFLEIVRKVKKENSKTMKEGKFVDE